MVILVKISPLILPLSVILVLTNNIGVYLLTYLVMAIHEFAHLFVAYVIGLKTDCIIFSPFGVNLRLKNRIINTLSEEIILYSAGPLVNGILALISIYFKDTNFYHLNIALFITNLLPIIPLDGGMITLRLLSYRFGYKAAKKVLGAFSAVLGLGLLALSVYLMLKGSINISIFIIAVFLIGNILTGKEKYNIDLIKSLSDGKKHSNNVKFVIINNDYSMIDAINEFSTTHTVFAISTDKNGKIAKILSESEIIEKYHCDNLTL